MASDELDLDDDATGGDGRKVTKKDNQKKSSGANVAAQELLQFIERIERLTEEKQTIADDIRDVLGEAVGRGYDKKAIRQILAIRKKDRNEYLEEQSVLDTYLHALGMVMLDQVGDD